MYFACRSLRDLPGVLPGAESALGRAPHGPPTRLLRPVLTLALTLLLSAHPAMACGPYTVAFYEFGQLYYHDANGAATGIDKDLVEALAQHSGCRLLPTVESRVRIWDQLARGQLDMTVSGVSTPNRLQQAEFWPYFRSRNHALLRKDLAQRLPTPAAFLAATDRRAVVVRSFRHGSFFDGFIEQLRAQKRVDEVADFDTALRVFKSGRVDLMLAHPLNLSRQKEPWLAGVAQLDWGPHDDVLGALVVSRSRVSEADRTRLRASLTSLLRDGSIDGILIRHAGATLGRQASLPASSVLP